MRFLSNYLCCLLQLLTSLALGKSIQHGSQHSNTQTSVATDFCTNNKPGLYCHPRIGNMRILCKTQKSEPQLISCPVQSVCRTHQKLYDLLLTSHSTAESHLTFDNELELFAQCVPLLDDQMDEFCVEKLSKTEFNAAAVMTYGVIGETSVCNPSTGNSKQRLTCRLVKKKCSLMVDRDCFDSFEVAVSIASCPGFNACRSYSHYLSADHAPKCFPGVETLCLDRFWAIYAEELVADPSLQAGKKHFTFNFCDPWRKHRRLECHLDLRFIMSNEPAYQSTIPARKFLDFKKDLRDRSHKLFQHIFPSISSTIRWQVAVDTLKIVYHFCPTESVYSSQLNPKHRRIAQDLAISGPVCRQLTRTLSRCMPHSRVDISAINRSYKDRNLPFVSLEETIGPYAGFCAGRSSPGQFCVPGWPEVGILCPFGKLVSCRRPEEDSSENVNDLHPKLERCVQMFGNIPPVSNTSSDAFRKSAVMDLHGRELTYGWYASCNKGTLDDLKTIQHTSLL